MSFPWTTVESAIFFCRQRLAQCFADAISAWQQECSRPKRVAAQRPACVHPCGMMSATNPSTHHPLPHRELRPMPLQGDDHKQEKRALPCSSALINKPSADSRRAPQMCQAAPGMPPSVLIMNTLNRTPHSRPKGHPGQTCCVDTARASPQTPGQCQFQDALHANALHSGYDLAAGKAAVLCGNFCFYDR
jgi:hypothetical protein